jgi:RimJ/RimL family protein N-acetyltransferase/nitroimidazol reductase NimA-like FMN-containing flavoprotein (pyridoxamine 5'-phosphate oxidase superfamily)
MTDKEKEEYPVTNVYPPTPRTTATRHRGRMHYERAVAHAILDEAYDCSVGFVVDDAPRVLPTLHVRVDDTVYLHGSTGGRLGLSARGGGVQVCVTATLLDGIVYGRSHLHHGANYRSVVAFGTARPVTDNVEKLMAMTALVEKVGHGRAADSRPPTRRELAETAVLALPLQEVSVRARSGAVVDEEVDLTLPHWAGVLPLRRVAGPPEPDTGVGAAPPDYLQPARSPWYTAVPMRGRQVLMEQLAPAHTEGLLAALADDEVWRYLPTLRPRNRDEMAAQVTSALRDQWLGERVPWVQRDPASGVVIGMTSYHDIDPERRSLGIGHTVLGRRWWRTGVNTESKLLLLEHAFDVLGAERVFWYTDVRNQRSQQAIARLGASRDGVIRRHRLRPDGTWRDSVLFAMTADEWPAKAARLRAMLRPRPVPAEPST